MNYVNNQNDEDSDDDVGGDTAVATATEWKRETMDFWFDSI